MDKKETTTDWDDRFPERHELMPDDDMPAMAFSRNPEEQAAIFPFLGLKKWPRTFR